MTSDERWQQYFRIRDSVNRGSMTDGDAYDHMKALCNTLLCELDRMDGTNAARLTLTSAATAPCQQGPRNHKK